MTENINELLLADITRREMSHAVMDIEGRKDPEWIIPNRWERGIRFVLTGNGGIGKAAFIRETVFCIAAGIDRFNPSAERFDPSKVVIIDMQDDIIQNGREWVKIKDRFEVAYPGSVALAESNFVTLDYSPGDLNLSTEKGLEYLQTLHNNYEPDVICILPVYRAMGIEDQTANETKRVRQFQRNVDQFRQEYRTSFLIEGHPPGETAEGKQKKGPSGSAAWSWWADAGYFIDRIDKGEEAHHRVGRLHTWRYDRSSFEPTPLYYATEAPFHWFPMERSEALSLASSKTHDPRDCYEDCVDEIIRSEKGLRIIDIENFGRNQGLTIREINSIKVDLESDNRIERVTIGGRVMFRTSPLFNSVDESYNEPKKIEYSESDLSELKRTVIHAVSSFDKPAKAKELRDKVSSKARTQIKTMHNLSFKDYLLKLADEGELIYSEQCFEVAVSS